MFSPAISAMLDSRIRLRWLFVLMPQLLLLSTDIALFGSLAMRQPTVVMPQQKQVPRRQFLTQSVAAATAAVGWLTIPAAEADTLMIDNPPTMEQQQPPKKYPITQVDGKDWKDVLTSGQYFVLRQGGTEPPFSSPLVSEKRTGVYVCAGCVSPLFDSHGLPSDIPQSSNSASCSNTDSSSSYCNKHAVSMFL